MRRPVQRRPRLARLALATAAASLLAIFASTAAAAAPAPLPPGSLALALAAQGSPPAPARADDGVTPAADGSICYFGACYNYVAGRQYAWYATGASVRLWRGRPGLDPADANSHSLQELAVQSVDGLQIVEIGWTVDRSLNGDDAPHLFVYHWIDGIPTCYDACGFVQTSTATVPGMKLPSGAFSTFRIEHVGDRWQLSLDGTTFGYFPDALWGGTAFTQPLLIQAFGEVASTSTPTCNQMGTGKYADSPASSAITGFTLLGPTPTPVDLAPALLVTTPEWYDASRVAPDGFWLGGPGSGRCAPH
ncbi:MAG TPA: neprosin family prolyl endopeptidase [Gaiellaceae bacterium]|jgi:hypothetical protein|nr:neprosin family prolyl endopeptidase [Gaiellaceae bacterium]